MTDLDREAQAFLDGWRFATEAMVEATDPMLVALARHAIYQEQLRETLWDVCHTIRMLRLDDDVAGAAWKLRQIEAEL